MRPSSWLRCPHQYGKLKGTETYSKFRGMKRHEKESDPREEQVIHRCTWMRVSLLTTVLTTPHGCIFKWTVCTSCQGTSQPSVSSLDAGSNQEKWKYHASKTYTMVFFLNQLMVVKNYIGKNKEAHIQLLLKHLSCLFILLLKIRYASNAQEERNSCPKVMISTDPSPGTASS